MFTKDMTLLLQITPEMKYWNALICLHLPADSSKVPGQGVVFVKKKFIPRVQRQTDGSYYVWMTRWGWSRFLEVTRLF